MIRRFFTFEIILSVLVIAVTLYGAFSDAHNFPRNWFDRDDAYYYYKVAQNITEGKGITFDGVDRTNGYHPLWMLVCIPIFALARFDLILPLRVLFVVMGLLRLGGALLLYRLLRRAVTNPIAMLFAAYWAFDYIIELNMYKQGLETGVAAFFIVLMAYLLSQKEERWEKEPASRRDIILVAALATLVLFSRLDLVFLAILVGLRVVFRNSYLRDLLGLDLLFIATSVLASFVLRLDIPEYYAYSDAALTLIAISTLVRIPVLYFMGVYEDLGSKTPFEITKQVLLSAGISTVIITPLMLTAASLLHFDVFPRVTLVYDALFFFGFLWLSRLGAHWFTRSTKSERQTPMEVLKRNWKNWLNDGLLYYGIVIGALAAYMLFSQLTFGTTSPVSGQVKRWWGSFAGGNVYGGVATTKLDFYGVNPETDYNIWPPLVWGVWRYAGLIFHYIPWSTWWQYKYGWTLVGALVLLAVIFSAQRKYSAHGFSRLAILPLFAACGFQLISYNAGGYAGVKEWYWAAQYIVIVLVYALLVDGFANRLMAVKGGNIFVYLVATLFVLLRAENYTERMYQMFPYYKTPSDAPYMDAIPFLEARTPPGAMIGLTGGGNVGYFIHDRTIVNMDGLINSYGYFKALQSRTAGQYLAEIGLDYIFANPEILDAVPYYGQFDDLYEVDIDRFGGKVLIKLKQDSQ